MTPFVDGAVDSHGVLMPALQADQMPGVELVNACRLAVKAIAGRCR